MQWKKEGDILVVIMDHGEDFIENILELIEKCNLTGLGSVVTALGMMNEVKTGYFDGEKYHIHEAGEPVELLGISGIITPETDPPYHFHVILGKSNGEVMGGHLIEGKVWNTLEMVLILRDLKLKRLKKGNLRILSFDD